MSRIFLDPDAADGAADKLLDLDSELLVRASRIELFLEEGCVASRAPRDARHAAEVCGRLATDLRTRAALVRNADLQCAPLSVRGLLIGRPWDEIKAAVGAGDPAAVNHWWNGLSVQQQAWLKTNARDAISGLDGIPVDVRHQLNRQRIHEQIAADSAAFAALPLVPRYDRRRNELKARIANHQAMLAGGLTVLLYDPTGDGRAAVALGDLPTATHIGVLVPGTGTELNNFPGMIKIARNLNAETRRLGSDDHAIIAWLGYDTPPNVPMAGTKGYAEQGAKALAPFIGGLRAVNTRHAEVTVMGHSYGSTVTGMAASAGMEADRIVLVGSPGTGAQHIEGLAMDPKDVYVARVSDDPIRHVFKSGEAKNYLVGGWVGVAAGKIVGYNPDVHGPDPSLPEFGATPLPYDDKNYGHSGYYKEGSLSMRNHARLIVGLSPTMQASGSGP